MIGGMHDVRVCLLIGGITVLPYAFKCGGIFMSIILLVVMAWICAQALWILRRWSDSTGKFNYKEIMTLVYGPRMGRVLQFCLMMYNSILCVSYVVLMGDFVPKVFAQLAPDSFLTVRGWCILVVIILVCPLCCVRSISLLDKSSFISIACITLMVGSVVYRFYDYDNGMSDDVQVVITNDAYDLFIAASMYVMMMMI